MSVQFSPRTLFEATEIDWQITAVAWRGSCLELFSRAEASLDQCLEDLARLGFDLGPAASHPGATARFRALSEFVAADTEMVHGPACVRMLENWSHLLTQRVLVAHGNMSVSDEGVRLSYREYMGKKGHEDHKGSFSRIEMLTLLKKLSEDQLQLHQQLGQIRAEARRKAARH